MKGAGAKAKGANGERELAALLIEWAAGIGLGLELKRNLEQTRGGGHDLVGLEDFGMAVECKRQEALALGSWWAQTIRQAEKAGCLPVLAWRQNRRPWRFRIRAWVHPCHRQLDIDLEADEFRAWFQSTLAAGPRSG